MSHAPTAPPELRVTVCPTHPRQVNFHVPFSLRVRSQALNTSQVAHTIYSCPLTLKPL